MRNLKIGKRLIFGFAVLILLIAGSSFNSIWQINGINQKAQDVINLRLPTAQASASILNGVNHALAALRGWMILGNDKFKQEREVAWDTEINNALLTLEEKSVNWTNLENVSRLAQLKSLLKDFENEQKQIEEIAQTIQNTPSLELLYDQAVPQASIMSKQITLMIDLEAQLEATAERKALLGMMADVRGTLGLALANIRGYLLSGEAKFKDDFETLWAKNDRRFSDLENSQSLLNYQQAKAFKLFEDARAIFSPLPSIMLSMRSQKNWNLANHWLATKAAPIGFQIKVILKEMADNQALLLNNDALVMTRRAEKAETISWLQLLLGLVFGILAAKFVTNSIVNPIDSLKESITQSQKNSDLTVRSSTKGQDEVTEIAGAFNDMMNGFQQTLNNVTDASHQIASASEESSVITEQTSMAVKQQQAETTQLALAMDEMSLTVNEIAKNTTQTSTAADKATGLVGIGMQGMQGTISTVNNLASVIEKTESAIMELEQRTVDISSVLDVISGVADQTNLLALNAAIEAARAGEQGRGFAVVADEVRTLASRTQESTGEITSIIDQLQQKAKQAVASMKESKVEVKNAVSQADETGKSLNAISDVIHRINDMSIQIATAAEEQGAVAIEVSRNVGSINAAAEQTADAATQTSQSSHELAGLASSLNNLVQRFKVI